MNHIIRKPFTAALGAAVLIAWNGLPDPAPAQTNDNPVPTGTNSAAKPAAKLEELFGDAVIARGKGVEIKRSRFDSALDNFKASIAARGQVIPPAQMGLLEQQVLQQLIGFELVLGRATDADKARGRELFDKSLQRLKTDAKLTEEEFNDKLSRQLKMQGLTKEQWMQQGIDEATVPVVLERELKINVTDADVKKYYDDHASRFEEPEKVRASHILLGTLDPVTRQELTAEQKAAKKKLAEDLLKRARAGEDFAKLAKEYSEDPGSKDNGGEYTFPRGQMVAPFEAAAFSMTNNQISDIITTQFGYHIIKLSEKIPAKKLTLAEVADDLKEGLKGLELQKLAPDYMEKLKKEADVVILDEKLKPKENLPDMPAAPKTGPAKAEEKKP